MLDAAFKAAILAFIGLAVVTVVRDRPADLDETRRRGRVAFVVAVWLYASVGIVLQLVFDGRLPPALVRANVAFLFVVAFGLAAALALGAPILARRARAVERATSPEEVDHAPRRASVPGRRVRVPASIDTALVARIRAAMESERLYHRESLTVAGLAAALGSQEYRVRRAINQGLGYRNFNEFLHRYRLDEGAARLRTQMHLPVLTIALDVGFGSIGPFNRAFRARYGCTPTAWRSGPVATTGAAEGADAGVAAI
jgi:AraC-like DNA-binding protein